jgi:D-alanine-D-alanine ligase
MARAASASAQIRYLWYPVRMAQDSEPGSEEARAAELQAIPAAPRPKSPKPGRRKRLAANKEALKRLRLVAVAYSHVKTAWFPTREAYEAEVEVEQRAKEVVVALKKLGVKAKAYRADRYFMAKLLVDQPDLVLNLVDTFRGSDALQTSVPGALELAGVPYTGAGMRGLVIGNDRHLAKELLEANDIPTPPYQLVMRRGTALRRDLPLPLIVKLNESGGSVGIDNAAPKETYEDAEQQIDFLLETYKMPVVVERFIDGPEVTAVVFDDGERVHVFCAQKLFKESPDRKYLFTSFESYNDPDCYRYTAVAPEVDKLVSGYARAAFAALRCEDYAKFDVRMDPETGAPYFIDANPNTAFGPGAGLPMTEVLAFHGVSFSRVLASLMTKHARRIFGLPAA